MSKRDRKSKEHGANRRPPAGGVGTGAEVEVEEEEVARRAGEEELERRHQAIQDKSLGAPVTGMPGSPKPARR